jgi:hypothetical protein
MPCGWETPEDPKAGSLRPSSTHLDIPGHTLMHGNVLTPQAANLPTIPNPTVSGGAMGHTRCNAALVQIDPCAYIVLRQESMLQHLTTRGDAVMGVWGVQ